MPHIKAGRGGGGNRGLCGVINLCSRAQKCSAICLQVMCEAASEKVCVCVRQTAGVYVCVQVCASMLMCVSVRVFVCLCLPVRSNYDVNNARS